MRRAMPWVLAAVLVCSIVIGFWLASGNRGLMRRLARATPERAFAARLSIPTRYHECEPAPADNASPVRREVCNPGDEGPLSVRELMAARKSSDPDRLQASALSTVIWWDDEEASLDSAVARLQKALRLSPGSVPLLVDLSAAHLVRAERAGNSRDLLQGLDYAETALALDPRNAGAQWNAALALQSFGLDWQADEAWAAYLAIDSISPWAAEARERRDNLVTRPAAIPLPDPGAHDSVVEAFVTHHPQQARELGWDRVLGDWGAAVGAGNTARADSLLDFAERLGRGVKRRPGGDGSLAEAVRAIRRAAGDAAATVSLARAHQAYAKGRAAIKEVDYDEVEEVFARVVSQQPPSPVLVQWATMWVESTRISEAGTGARLQEILTTIDSTQLVLAGRARAAWGRALLHGGQYSKALEQFRIAQELFRSAGETALDGYVLTMHGEAAYESGDTAEAYRLMHQAHLALRWDSIQSRHNNLIALAQRAVRDEMPRAALPIYDEIVRAAERTAAKVNIAEALQYRARVRTIVGDSVGAARDLESALVRSQKLSPDNKQVRQAKALIRLARPGGLSPAAMDSTIDELSENVLWLIPAWLWRAEARLVEGDMAGAILDLDSVTARIRGLSGQTDETWLRATMIEQARSTFDQLVMLHLANNDVEAALRVLERARVSLAPGTQPLGPRRLSPPPGTRVVQYALIGDTLLAWVPRGDSIDLMHRVVDRDTFLLTVERVNAQLEFPTGERAARPGLRRLYEWLIHPLRERLGGEETTLVILADNEVAGVPFQALWNEERQRYLVQDHVLRFATTLADALSPPLTERRPSGQVLLVADPEFDEGDHAPLERLPGAREEVDSLRRLYPGALVLEGPGATHEAFRAQAETASLIHYAGHAVFDDGRPERSYLVLAGTDTASRLTAQDISTMELRGAPLVVLSACRSLRSREGRMDGFAGLSGELLATGATGVIGSLWQADDELTKPLMVAFHREYPGSPDDPARALRAAQLHMIRLRDPVLSSPAAWAGFRYIGN